MTSNDSNWGQFSAGGYESYNFFKSTCINCSVKTSVLFEMSFLQWHNVEVDDIGCNFAQKRLVVRLVAVLVKHCLNPYFSFFLKNKKMEINFFGNQHYALTSID